MSEIFLFVEISLKPGVKSEFLEHLARQAQTIRDEKGCKTLEVLQSNDLDNRVCVWEIWESRASWDFHMSNAASKRWQGIASEFVVQESITVLEKSKNK